MSDITTRSCIMCRISIDNIFYSPDKLSIAFDSHGSYFRGVGLRMRALIWPQSYLVR